MSFTQANAPALVLLFAAVALLPVPASAEWNVVKQHDTDTNSDTLIARTRNDDGYSLEIYRDSVGAVRGRFALRNGLIALGDRDCPTYQVDRAVPVNRSINNARCISTSRWAEFVLGYIKDNQVDSPRLLALMNGISIVYRFRLADGDYRETQFSLSGSKRSVLAALGSDVTAAGD